MTTEPAMQSETLQPCPFCGGEVRVYSLFPTKATYSWHLAGNHVAECPLTNGKLLVYRTEAEAIEAWNTRATVKISDAMVERGARAIADESRLFWDDDDEAHRAASPLTIEVARETVRAQARACLTAALGPTT